ncbi:MAG TPA: class I SAM-dependent methyltransferase [Dehalococcoidia bacterium]|jgi:SAM-dependent methyltransferase|nr:methyltransferase type 11 [Chloroflexota bacterium]MDP5876558.1 class I SAM-dependent methyltransferase [Dehalococcoidia bacterium]MDP6272514.1 class I SAM-dependent methyltransferase [Dehalococcoidia bacterium]MDP7161285.1 class I SAM-dependent methyltransferase [Dehalococcoidia bacterium]MDP7213141.1 class I SAM-dependent methyltransferase [Dehalococcoidia bacterium]|tara:strand:- start:2072 stop:2734 length:663 start_codon:yes stop_codon:yes gene_type:complete
MPNPLPPGADPRQIVADGYDAIGKTYLREARKDHDGLREQYIGYLTEGFSGCSEVLDLGCGAGDPGTVMLSIYFDVTGVDISSGQIELAKEHVPAGEFIVADIAEVEFPPDNFDAITAFYSIIHVPRELQPGLIEKISTWLRPGGRFIGTFHSGASAEDYDPNWLGAPMYWSGYGPEDNRLMVEAAGLRIISARNETVEFDVDGTPTTFQWIVAEKVLGE